MKKNCIIYFVLFITPLSVLSEDTFMFTLGTGMNDMLIQSGDTSGASVVGLGWQHDLNAQWESQLLGVADVYLNTEWHHLNGEEQNINYSLNIIELKPVLRFDAGLSSDFFYEGALGVAYLSDTKFEEITTSSHFQFAIHLGVGWYLDEAKKWDVSFRYNHYSNGYFSSPNPGLDFLSLTANIQFH